MSAEPDDIFRDICALLQPLNKEGIELTRETRISADLNVDSMAIMDFIMEVEDRYDIDIPLNDLSDIYSIDQLVHYVHGLVSRKKA